MPVYEFINPSDPVTVEAADPRVAIAAVLFAGEGAYALAGEDGEEVFPIVMFANDEQMGKLLADRGIVDLALFVKDHRKELADCLATAIVASVSDRKAVIAAAGGKDVEAALQRWNEAKRASLNDICGRCHRMAKALREKEAA